MDAGQLRIEIVRPALEAIGLWSKAAENLVMGTAAQESHLKYVKQIGSGPALGLFQMEPFTYTDHWEHYLRYPKQAELRQNILSAITAPQRPPADRMVWDLRFASIMCRVDYRRVPEPLPKPNDIAALASYWKRTYNSASGSGTEAEFVKNYARVS